MNAALPHNMFFWSLAVLCLTGFVVLYWAVRDAGRGARQRAVRRRIDALGTPAADTDEAAVDALEDAMAQARQALRQAPRPRTARDGTDAPVPWFLFLGDAAANLPGLLSAAHGERPTPPASEPFGGAYWRWWLTSAMAAIELHASAVSEAAMAPHTRSLWLHALLALAERRDRLPLNGLVVCIGASELLRADAEASRPMAARMRRLLDEAGDALRLQLPVYLVVTGLEQLAGYATLRGALPPEVLAQALGHRLAGPFAAAGTTAGEWLDAVFDPLALQLHALRMALLREQSGAAGRLAIHEFVEAVHALHPALRHVAEALFESHGKGSRPPRWRGLYFTAAASAAAGGAFVNDLFARFLPADRPLARPGRPSSNANAAAP
jgi:type VI secretion system protein ImpL